jgi:ketosteroid isomerase-like protein
MSQENVEIVRRIVEALIAGVESGDFASAWDSGAVADDVEWVADRNFLGQRSFKGQEGFVAFVRGWTEDFEEYSLRCERLVDAAEDRVLGFFTESATGTSATGKGSGATVEQPFFVVFDMSRGQLVRMQAYIDRAQALEAAGLRE